MSNDGLYLPLNRLKRICITLKEWKLSVYNTVKAGAQYVFMSIDATD